jgi:cellulose synthase/poly-beta-1,6-N-acetylglucosamine synthase-like glycosyltransferase
MIQARERDAAARRGARPRIPFGSALDWSINGLRRQHPEMSAEETLSHWQRNGLLCVGALAGTGLVVAPLVTGVLLCALATAVYMVLFLYRAYLLQQTLQQPGVVEVTDEEARGVADTDLPVYTVMVAAYREPQVIGQVIDGINALEYPPHLLDVKLLLEADDFETIQAAEAKKLGAHIEIVRVPYAEPRTKPKACNYGLNSATGEIVTVFDAEDKPDPLQLRKAVVAFRRLPENIACLQAKLSYYNSRQNLLTRWFTAEYETWFPQILPVLVSHGVPAPLGGTSMHVKREVLESVGAWDPHNVTEDADLGLRLHRFGYRTEVLGSTTYEEANSDAINWFKQRSRWYKGYLQTWLVHMRHPLALWRALGPRGFLGFNLMIGGTPLIAIVNPLFWLLALLWFSGRLEFIQTLFPGWIYYPAMFCMLIGNFVVFYETILSVSLARRADLFWSTLLLPGYWILMSVAGVKAVVQLISAPKYWEKTTHGLDHAALAATHHGAESRPDQNPIASREAVASVPEPVRTSRGLTVVLPAHNEEAQIGATVAACVATLSVLAPEYEVVVVNDGSTDRTGVIVEAIAMGNPRVRVVHNVPQRGYGGALQAGFAAAAMERVFFMDSDGQFDIGDLGMLLPWADRGYQAVLGYRVHRSDPLVRLLNAKAWNALVSLVFHLHIKDIDCAFKLFDRLLIDRIDIRSEGAVINTEILVKLKTMGIDFVEAPVQHFPRQHGTATGANPKVIMRAFKELFWLRGTMRAWLRSSAIGPTAGAGSGGR